MFKETSQLVLGRLHGSVNQNMYYEPCFIPTADSLYTKLLTGVVIDDIAKSVQSHGDSIVALGVAWLVCYQLRLALLHVLKEVQ